MEEALGLGTTLGALEALDEAGITPEIRHLILDDEGAFDDLDLEQIVKNCVFVGALGAATYALGKVRAGKSGKRDFEKEGEEYVTENYGTEKGLASETDLEDINVTKVTDASGNFNYSVDRINKYIEGKLEFNDVIDEYAKLYTEKVKSNSDWSWNKSIPGGKNLSIKQKKLIKQYAIDNNMIPEIKVNKVDGMKYGFADFEQAGVVKETRYLPEELWRCSDAEQFCYLDEQIGGHVDGYTWHHTEVPGKMQLVPSGLHNITTHNGGRTTGMWADAPR